jgi:hypothetical protein
MKALVSFPQNRNRYDGTTAMRISDPNLYSAPPQASIDNLL